MTAPASNDVLAMQQRIAQLERELEDCKQSEATFRAAYQALAEQGAAEAAASEAKQAESALLRQTLVLSRTTSMLVERDRQLQAFQRIGQAILAYLDRQRILDTLAEQLAAANILKEVSIALIRTQGTEIAVETRTAPQEGPAVPEGILRSVRSGQVYIESSGSGQAVYHIPVKNGDQVLAVLQARSPATQRKETLQRIASMQPLLELIAVALEHARLYEAAQTRSRQVIRLERQRALAEMAMGVSHNLNNMLAAILVPAQFLQKNNPDAQVRRDADEIVTAGRRAADLVRRLYRSVQPRENEVLEAVRLDRVAAEALDATRDRRRQRGVPIRIETDLKAVPPVQGVALEMHNIAVNLILNAVDALPEGGTITLRTAATAQGALLAVEDDGIGMDEETRSRVFEPFFTTKDDVGPGLGLSTANNAVTYWGGQIEVESTPGGGSTFTVQLPAAVAQDDDDGEAPQQADPHLTGRLLIVEDDPTVRDVLTNLLSETHEVDAVASGALAVERAEPGRYDVALVDFGLPDLAGDRVVEALRQRDRRIATVLITGWNLAPARTEAFDFCLQKPFHDLDRLEDTVAHALELRRSRA